MCVVSVSEFAENEEIRDCIRRSDRIRHETLNLMYEEPGIPGIEKASRETKTFIYDEIKKVVEKIV